MSVIKVEKHDREVYAQVGDLVKILNLDNHDEMWCIVSLDYDDTLMMIDLSSGYIVHNKLNYIKINDVINQYMIYDRLNTNHVRITIEDIF